MKKGQTAGNRLSHLICPRRFHTGAGFGTWSPVTALAGRGGCRGFIGPVPLPLSIRLTVNIARRGRGVKRFSSPIDELGSENLEQIPKEISKWPRRNGLSVRKRQRPMSVDLGLLPMTPQTGHCARAASQALLKELLGKGLARRGISGCVASAGQALVGRKGPTPF